MARRSLIPGNVTRAQTEMSRYLRELYSQYDIAEFRAQTHAADMVDILAGFARDPTQAVTFRRDCANDVLNRAYGTPAQKATTLQLDPASQEGGKVAALIDQSRETTAMLALLDQWTQVSYEDWPDNIREQLGEFGKAFAEQQSGGTVVLQHDAAAD